MRIPDLDTDFHFVSLCCSTFLTAFMLVAQSHIVVWPGVHITSIYIMYNVKYCELFELRTHLQHIYYYLIFYLNPTCVLLISFAMYINFLQELQKYLISGSLKMHLVSLRMMEFWLLVLLLAIWKRKSLLYMSPFRLSLPQQKVAQIIQSWLSFELPTITAVLC